MGRERTRWHGEHRAGARRCASVAVGVLLIAAAWGGSGGYSAYASAKNSGQKSYASTRALADAIGSRSGCAKYAALTTKHSLIPTTEAKAHFAACAGSVDGHARELFIATYADSAYTQRLLLALGRFACLKGEAELDSWSYVRGPKWVVGVDALAMGRAVLGLQSYPPPVPGGHAKLAAKLASRVGGKAHTMDCTLYRKLASLPSTPPQSQIDQLLKG